MFLYIIVYKKGNKMEKIRFLLELFNWIEKNEAFEIDFKITKEEVNLIFPIKSLIIFDFNIEFSEYFMEKTITNNSVILYLNFKE